MKLCYHAWLRDRVGRESEDIHLPGGIRNVGMLLDCLATRTSAPGIRSSTSTSCCSVNSVYANRYYPVHDEDEVDLVPPIAAADGESAPECEQCAAAEVG